MAELGGFREEHADFLAGVVAGVQFRLETSSSRPQREQP
jgi:hypothetical protein